MPFRVGGKSKVDDYALAAEACLPIIGAILDRIRNHSYPNGSFLNVDLPADIANHKVNFTNCCLTGRQYGIIRIIIPTTSITTNIWIYST